MYRRESNFFCLNFKESAIISLAERKEVSPEVIGAATTPNIARIPPTIPSQRLLIIFTTFGA